MDKSVGSSSGKGKIKIGILLGSSAQMTILAVACTIPMLLEHFEGASITTIQTLFTIPSLVSIPVNLLVGALTPKIGKKIPLVVGLAIMAVGGLIPAFMDVSLSMLTGCIVAFGVGLGMMIPTVTGLIPDHFQGPEQGDVMGKQSAFINMGTMVLSLLAGYIAAASGWRNAFLVYFYLILLVAVVIFTIPKDTIQRQTGGQKAKVKLSKEVYIMSIFVLLHGLLFGVFNTNTGMLLGEKAIGDASTTGNATSFMTGIGILVGLLYGRISGVLKSNTLAAGAAMVSVGMFGLYISSSSIMVYIFSMVCGFGFSLVMPTGLFRCSMSVDAASSTMAISIYLAAVNIGMFLTQYVMNPLSTALGDGSATLRFLMASIGLAGLAVFGYITRPKAQG